MHSEQHLVAADFDVEELPRAVGRDRAFDSATTWRRVGDRGQQAVRREHHPRPLDVSDMIDDGQDNAFTATLDGYPSFDPAGLRYTVNRHSTSPLVVPTLARLAILHNLFCLRTARNPSVALVGKGSVPRRGIALACCRVMPRRSEPSPPRL